MNASPSPKSIVILGGGVAGWTAAAALARSLPPDRYSLTLVEERADAANTEEFGPAFATLPSAVPFHQQLGIDENLLLRAAHGSFALGTAFSGWAEADRASFLPFGAMGAPMGPVAFHQLAAKLRAAAKPVRLADYSLAALAAQAGRFARPSEDERSIRSQYAYGVHFETAGYRAALRATALALGVRRAPAPFRRGILDGAGQLSALELEDGSRAEGIFFLDCSGMRARLIAGVFGLGFESWRDWLPCDRMVARITRDGGTPSPFAHAEARPNGWRHTIPLHGLRAETIHWCSAFPDNTPAASFNDPDCVLIEAGRRERAWHANCLALGAAAVMIEPLHAVGHHLLQSAIERLVALLPDGPHAPVEAAEYNRLAAAEHRCARDFTIAHYLTNGRSGEPFWDMCRAMVPPASLTARLDMFERRGRVPIRDGDIFEEEDWVALFDAQGVHQQIYDRLADQFAPATIEDHLARLRAAIIGGLRGLPGHGEYLQHCIAAAGGRA